MLVTDFDFDLPEELIAQQPPATRGGSRMLAVNRKTGEWQDEFFHDLPQHFRTGDLLVLNNSRVIPARLFARRETSRGAQAATGQIEVLLTEQRSEVEWQALVRPGRKVGVGEQLVFYTDDKHAEGGAAPVLKALVTARGEYGERTLRFESSENFFEILDRIGHVPLPPYIHREVAAADTTQDRERYQTVYARDRGSVAAPTAGLHFTAEVLDELRRRGVRIAFVTLHVGLGTFAPLRVDRVDEVRLHSERYTLPDETAAELNAARSEGRRIIAAGTTTVRTLEHCASSGPESARLEPAGLEPLRGHSGSTSIFISPGFEFRIVDAMLTNFHLPQSSLLMLVSAFAGRENVLAAYRHAVAEKYRFFSYGDCMWIA